MPQIPNRVVVFAEPQEAAGKATIRREAELLGGKCNGCAKSYFAWGDMFIKTARARPNRSVAEPFGLGIGLETPFFSVAPGVWLAKGSDGRALTVAGDFWKSEELKIASRIGLRFRPLVSLIQ